MENLYIKNVLNKMLHSDEYRFYVQTMLTSFLLATISFVSLLINVIAGNISMGFITGIMMVIGYLLTVYTYTTRKIQLPRLINFFVFFLSAVLFLYNGAGNGFSALWIILLPFISIFLYGNKVGGFISWLMFGIIIILFWSPLINSIPFHYDNAFVSRFPFVYLTCLFFASILEYMNELASHKLKNTEFQLDKISKQDSLTKLDNRLIFEEKLHKFGTSNKFNDTVVSILIIDIDNFKAYNDHYGNVQGDKVIVSVSKVLNDKIFEFGGHIYRWGGEEFICLIPNTTDIEAKKIGEELVSAVTRAKIPHENTNFARKIVTVSVGGVSTSQSNYKKAIYSANTSLFEAKYKGKNQVGTITTI